MKNKVAAGVLSLIVGVFGVHRFYLGQVGLGFLYFFFFWFPLIWIIAFIDGIVFLTMSDDDFDFKYNRHLYQQNRSPRDVNININTNQRQRGAIRTDRYRPREQDSPRVSQNRDRIRNQQPRHQRPSSQRIRKNNPFKEEGTKRYRDYDFKGAIEYYQKSLKVQPQDPQIHFNLACLYSLMEDPSASYMHLSKAVEQGYMYFDKIKTHDHLAFLRTQPDFEQFVKNGYKLGPKPFVAPNAPLIETRKPDVLELTDDVIAKLERLADLKNKGILTEEEFQLQKKKIIRGR